MKSGEIVAACHRCTIIWVGERFSLRHIAIRGPLNAYVATRTPDRLARIGHGPENGAIHLSATVVISPMYSTLKIIHVSAAILTISGFILRGMWMMSGSPLLQRRIVRVSPHVVDTILLLSGIALTQTLSLPVLKQPWLLAKLAALLVYIVLGMIALRHGKTREIRTTAFLLALATFAYIAGVALSKSLTSWLAFFLT